jgi:hypothetical protein
MSNSLDYMKRAAPGCGIPQPESKTFKGGAAHEKDSLSWRRLPH